MGKKAKERKRREREAQASIVQEQEPSILTPKRAGKAKARATPAAPAVPKAGPGTGRGTAQGKPQAPKSGAAPKGAATKGAATKGAPTPRAGAAPKGASAPKPPAATVSVARSKARSAAKPGTALHVDADGARAAAVSAPATASPGQLATRLNSVAIHLLRRLQREDTKLGLSGARLSALSVLVFGGPRTLGKLADAEGVSPPSMTRLVTAMESEGLVAREKNAADGRSVIIKASAEGERILIRGREQRVQALAGWLAELSGDGLVGLDTATATLEDLLKTPRSERTEDPKPDPGA